MSTFWPTAAAACCVARSVGRESSFRYGMPVAIAPDETSTTSDPRPWAVARASTRWPICPAFAPLIDDEPTLTTMRRALGISAREVMGPSRSGRSVAVSVILRADILVRLWALDSEAVIVPPESGGALTVQLRTSGGLGIHAFQIGLAALAVGRPVVADESGIGTSRCRRELGGRRQRRLPVEDDPDRRADDDGGSCDSPGLEQFVLDSEFRETVREGSDGLLIREVGLRDPALRLGAADAGLIPAGT